MLHEDVHARAWRHMNICASHPVWDPIGSVQAHTDGPRWSWCRGPALISHRRYLSVHLCPSKAASSFPFHSSSSVHLSSLFWLVGSISSFTLHLTARPTHPLPSLWLSLTHLVSQHQLLSFQSEELRHVVLQGPEYYKILHSKLKNLRSALPFFRPLISLYGSIWPAPPRALHPCVPSGPLYHAGAPGRRAN